TQIRISSEIVVQTDRVAFGRRGSVGPRRNGSFGGSLFWVARPSLHFGWPRPVLQWNARESSGRYRSARWVVSARMARRSGGVQSVSCERLGGRKHWTPARRRTQSHGHADRSGGAGGCVARCVGRCVTGRASDGQGRRGVPSSLPLTTRSRTSRLAPHC